MNAGIVGILEHFDAPGVEDLAARLLAAILAVVEFGRPDAETADYAQFEAATARALIASLAAWVAHPHQDDDQHQEALKAVIIRLRADVASAMT